MTKKDFKKKNFESYILDFNLTKITICKTSRLSAFVFRLVRLFVNVIRKRENINFIILTIVLIKCFCHDITKLIFKIVIRYNFYLIHQLLISFNFINNLQRNY